METIQAYCNHQQLAYAFCVFWLATYSGGLRYNSIYLARMVMVTAYILLMWADDRSTCSVIEYFARCLVTCSWIGVTAMIFNPELRWRKQRV